jgi:hypothetical protein
MIANDAETISDHSATFGVKLGKRQTGTYRLVVSIDAGGTHGTLTRSVHIH